MINLKTAHEIDLMARAGAAGPKEGEREGQKE